MGIRFSKRHPIFGTPGHSRMQYDLKTPDLRIAEAAAEGDCDLLARFRQGDREAFTLIYRMHSPAVFRFALHMSGDKVKATEITQDVFVWLIHHPDNFDPTRGGLGSFLIGVARRLLLHRWHDERRWVSLNEAGLDFDRRQGAASGADESEVTRLREFIAALPLRYREVVVLCDLEGHTYEAAAGMLECAVGTV